MPSCTTTAGLSEVYGNAKPGRKGCLGLLQVYPTSPDQLRMGWPLERACVVGRGIGVDIRLDDKRVSRQHALLEVSSGLVRVFDRDSSHGTYVDGKPAAARGTDACPGSVVRVGHTLLIVVDDINAAVEPLHKISGDFLGLGHDVLAGHDLWEAWQSATRVAPLAQPVLIVGESGSGKHVVARIVHAARPAPGPFVVASGAALGSLPLGADRAAQPGVARKHESPTRSNPFASAAGGVLFLDEIADLDAQAQATTLRAMDQVNGRESSRSAQVRVVASTCRDLEQACRRGQFRQDLWYRLSGITIRVPPLRTRRGDILAIAQSILASQSEKIELSSAAAEALLLAPWEGNVRQLESCVLHAMVQALGSRCDDILPEHLPELGPKALSSARSGVVSSKDIVNALANAQGNVSAAAKSLGISRATLYNLFKRYKLNARGVREREA